MMPTGASESSPALQRSVTHMFIVTSPVRGERTLLPSLAGLSLHVPLNPSVKTLGYSRCEVKENTVS